MSRGTANRSFEGLVAWPVVARRLANRVRAFHTIFHVSQQQNVLLSPRSGLGPGPGEAPSPGLGPSPRPGLQAGQSGHALCTTPCAYYGAAAYMKLMQVWFCSSDVVFN